MSSESIPKPKKYYISELTYTNAETAEYLGISIKTLRRYQKKGYLPEPLRQDKYIYVYPKKELDKFRREFLEHPLSQVSSK